MKPPFEVSRPHPNTTRVDMRASFDGWDQWFLLRGDVHWDNPNCNRALELQHLEHAKKIGAGVIDCGDLFCAMQGKYDNRSDKSSVRPEHQRGDYLDSLVRTASDYYEPFAHNFVVIGQGNHETAIKKRHETDLTQRLVERLRDRTGTTAQAGGYTGWVWFTFNLGKRRTSRRLWYTHGYGGGGAVTKDIIQANRQQVYIENADIMLSGHVHYAWQDEVVRQRLTGSGKVESRTLHYVKTPSYKDEYGDGAGGWSIERGMPPKPVGAWWLRFSIDSRGGKINIVTEIRRAQ